MIKKIILSILAVVTIVLALWSFKTFFFDMYIVKVFLNGGMGFKQFFFDFYLPLLPIFSTFTFAIFWAVWAMLKVHKEKITEAKANLSIIIDEKKEQRAMKQKEKNAVKIAKLKSKIEKIEGDE